MHDSIAPSIPVASTQPHCRTEYSAFHLPSHRQHRQTWVRSRARWDTRSHRRKLVHSPARLHRFEDLAMLQGWLRMRFGRRSRVLGRRGRFVLAIWPIDACIGEKIFQRARLSKRKKRQVRVCSGLQKPDRLTIHDKTQPVEDQRERYGPLHCCRTAGDPVASRGIRVAGADGVKNTKGNGWQRKEVSIREWKG